MEPMNDAKTLHATRGAVTGASFLIALAVTAGVSRAQFTGLYSFGDSLSDRGNTYNLFGGMQNDNEQDHAIYDELGYTAHMGRYDDGRWSNGPLWVEHLGGQLGLAPLERNNGMQPLTAGTDFAFGGATTGTNNPYNLFGILDLPKQVENFISIVGGNASSTALYTVWAGGNDVIYYIQFGSSDTHEQYAEKMAANIKTAVTDLYNAGGRHFLVPNLPPLGDKPDFVDTPNQAIANDIVIKFNPKLEQAMVDLRTQFPDLKLATWDVHSDFDAMLQDPMSFGFTDEKHAAYSSSGPYPGTVVANPNQHVFWDHTHPSAAGHALLGGYAYEALTILLVPEPSSLVLLSMGIGIVCVRRRRLLVLAPPLASSLRMVLVRSGVGGL
jgi:phospholipase/lecithinase/hemolysin